MPLNLTSKVRDEWILYEIGVIAKRQVQHPELRAEAREAFLGGAASMYRIFCDQISQIGSREQQGKAVQELGEEMRAFALEIGRR